MLREPPIHHMHTFEKFEKVQWSLQQRTVAYPQLLDLERLYSQW